MDLDILFEAECSTAIGRRGLRIDMQSRNAFQNIRDAELTGFNEVGRPQIRHRYADRRRTADQ